jgi:hypothetical protein
LYLGTIRTIKYSIDIDAPPIPPHGIIPERLWSSLGEERGVEWRAEREKERRGERGVG